MTQLASHFLLYIVSLCINSIFTESHSARNAPGFKSKFQAMKDMHMKRILMSGAALVAALMSAMPAQATTYIGNRSIGVGTAALSITTDDTLGVLSAANITDWKITVSKPGESALLNTGNSSFNFNSTALSASATQLLFNFDGVGGFSFTTSGGANGRPAYCINGALGPNCIGTQNTEGVFFSSGDVTQSFDGITILGTSGSGGVPEPASWALMIMGFGLTGAAIRRRSSIWLQLA
jgi:PEP-CTERM motif